MAKIINLVASGGLFFGMKRFFNFKSSARNLITGLSILAALTGAGLLFNNPVKAASSPCPGHDPNNNAVVYCGADSAGGLINKYDHGDGHNSASSIQHIYSFFGISSSDIHTMSSDSQMGNVTSGGDVFVGGNLVATGVTTAGRSNLSSSCGGSVHHDVGGTSFYTRPPCVSFVSSPLSAMVVMKNGVFQFAILNSCGNPVTGHPVTPKKPAYTVNKQVAVKGSNSFSKNITVKSGTHVIYRVEVDSTGQADVMNLKVSDNLPNNVTFVNGTLKKDGNLVNAGHFFDSGYGVGTLAAGHSVVFSFEAVVGLSDTDPACKPQSLNNTGSTTATNLPGQNSQATVNTQCQPKPAVACNSLTATPVSRSSFSFKGAASAHNSIIRSYSFNFGDGSAPQVVTTASTSATTQHQYAAPGNYMASVSVNFSGVSGPVTSPACNVAITVAQPPAAECTNLQLTPDPTNPRNFLIVASYQASNGAALQNISYDFGDGTTQNAGTQTTVNHVYAQDGNYTVKATLTFSGPSTVPPSTCQAPLTVQTAQPVCNLLQVSTDSNGLATVTDFQATANGATLGAVDIDWGDGTVDTGLNPVIGHTHQYAMPAAGTSVSYPITAVVHFMVNGHDVAVSGSGCQATISLSTPATPTPPPTPPTPVTSLSSTPASLVNTGPGSLAAVFGAAVILGTFGYRRYLRHHFRA